MCTWLILEIIEWLREAADLDTAVGCGIDVREIGP